MIAFGNYSIWQVILFAASATVVVYALTYIIERDRAERHPGAAVGAALVFSPWWAGLLAGLAAHLCCVMLVRRIKKRPVGKPTTSGLLLVLVALIGTVQVSFYRDSNELTEAVKASSDAVWAQLARRDEAGRFVNDNYRPCTEAVERQVVVPRGVTALSWRKTDPLVCKAAAVTLAKQKSPDFGEAVAETIDQLPKLMDLTPEAAAVVDRIVQRWSI